MRSNLQVFLGDVTYIQKLSSVKVCIAWLIHIHIISFEYINSHQIAKSVRVAPYADDIKNLSGNFSVVLMYFKCYTLCIIYAHVYRRSIWSIYKALFCWEIFTSHARYYTISHLIYNYYYYYCYYYYFLREQFCCEWINDDCRIQSDWHWYR